MPFSITSFRKLFLSRNDRFQVFASSLLELEGYGYATFLDSNGQKISGVDLSSYISHAYRINAHNNHYYIAGLSFNAESYVLLKMDSIGQVIWKKEYGGSNSDHCFGMDLSNDGFIFLNTYFVEARKKYGSGRFNFKI